MICDLYSFYTSVRQDKTDSVVCILHWTMYSVLMCRCGNLFSQDKERVLTDNVLETSQTT